MACKNPKPQSWMYLYLLGETSVSSLALENSRTLDLENWVTAKSEEHPAWHMVEGILPHDRWLMGLFSSVNITHKHLMVPVPDGQGREILGATPGHCTDLLLGLVQDLVPN